MAEYDLPLLRTQDGPLATVVRPATTGNPIYCVTGENFFEFSTYSSQADLFFDIDGPSTINIQVAWACSLDDYTSRWLVTGGPIGAEMDESDYFVWYNEPLLLTGYSRFATTAISRDPEVLGTNEIHVRATIEGEGTTPTLYTSIVAIVGPYTGSDCAGYTSIT